MDNIPLCRVYLKTFEGEDNGYGLHYNQSTELALDAFKGQRIGWFEVILPIICVLGLIGNLLNIIVLTRQRLLSRMDRLEKSATYGLTALAVSDMMFCIAVFPHCFIQHHENTSYPGDAYKLYYRLYGVGVINTFLMTSTWLVVYMAVSRFIVVVYPFHARRFLATSRGIAIIVLIYVISAALTLPFILHLEVQPCIAYISDNGAIKSMKHDLVSDNSDYSTLETSLPKTDAISDTNTDANTTLSAIHTNHAVLLYEFRTSLPKSFIKFLRFYINWLWPIVADYIPLFILLTLNIRLIKELQLAESRRRISCRGQSVRSAGGHTLTLTLVIIVLMLFLLVTPSEILRYLNPYKLWGKKAYVIVSVTNVLQTLNFAFNFVLYCVVSASFRKTVKSVFRCCLPGKSARYTHDKEALATEATLHCESTRRQGVSQTDPLGHDPDRGLTPINDTNVDDVLYLTYG